MVSLDKEPRIGSIHKVIVCVLSVPFMALHPNIGRCDSKLTDNVIGDGMVLRMHELFFKQNLREFRVNDAVIIRQEILVNPLWTAFKLRSERTQSVPHKIRSHFHRLRRFHLHGVLLFARWPDPQIAVLLDNVLNPETGDVPNQVLMEHSWISTKSDL